MEWAKLRSAARYNLATSGMAGFPLADLGVSIEQLEINGSANNYGYGPLLEAIARRYRVPGECVVTTVSPSAASLTQIASPRPPMPPVTSAMRCLSCAMFLPP